MIAAKSPARESLVDLEVELVYLVMVGGILLLYVVVFVSIA
jgi:hypothetical protein